MKVYVVTHYETPVSVWSTRELAEDEVWAKSHVTKGWFLGSWEVVEFEVQ